MRYVASALLVWVMTVAGPTLADAVSDGLSAWQRGDRTAARDYWQSAADRGDVDAMLLLSQWYQRGDGGEPDDQQALHWLANAAETGHTMASYNLGARYLNGVGVREDPVKAAQLWRRAAVQGLPQAQYNLGTLYLRGLGVPQDRAQAAWWYEQAAAQGSLRARQALDAMSRLQAVPDVTPSATAAQPAVVVMASPEAGEAWLQAQPAGRFVVQIFASPNAGAVQDLLRQHRFVRSVAVYRFERDGGQWLGVVIGTFESAAAARAAAAGLPSTLRDAKPWVRSLGELITIIH